MKRRGFIELMPKVIPAIYAGGALFSSCASEKNDQTPDNTPQETSPDESRPNIVIILADDAGWSDVGFHNQEIISPNLDRIAKEGVELTHFYVSPVCSPTRASLLTGRPPSRFGITGPLQLEHEYAIPPNTVTIAELLLRNGYDTAITGKWHLGMTPELVPNKYGFRHSYGYLGPWLDSWSHLTTDFKRTGKGVRQWHRNGKLIDEHGHVTDLVTDEAVRFITDIRDKANPFFLYVPYSAPHTPIQEEKKWIDMYDGTIENTSRKYFAASITHMDYGIGQILDALETEGVLDNTLVMFFSDNGGARGGNYPERWLKPPVEYYMEYGPTDVLGDNEPFHGWKGQHYEGGIRIPAIIRWKNRLTPGKADAPMIVYDLYPTFAHLADADIPAETVVEGENVWNYINGEQEDRTPFFYWHTGSQYVIRNGEWKLIHFGKQLGKGRFELYNIAEDPLEKTDLADKNLEMVEELFKEMKRQAALDRKLGE
ncbi:MAG: sulfatase-like hydrolase/transferase [Candidatus Latescibacteria bacterium]|nr:sulfatase-like hydrolase/transferase [Candidatus Latescibacterota bacterium]